MPAKRMKKDLGQLLVDKGIITTEMLLSATETLSREPNKGRRKLQQVLVEEFHLDHDTVYREVAEFYAFKSINASMEKVDEPRLSFIRRIFNGLSDSVKDLVVEHRVLPFGVDPETKERLTVITPDPTNTEVYFIARAFSYKKFEITYVPAEQWNELWQRVNIGRSGYLKKDGSDGSLRLAEDLEADETYEQDLEEEIHRSGLVDLVENIFVDAVRVGASDIHVIPKGERQSDFYFRIDGRLTLWYSHNEARAEAVSAVVKDRAVNVDRFERNTAQDGFAQFLIDKKTNRYRVSVIPIIGKELKNKFESIVIRVLQEPTVGKNLEELGFGPSTLESFRKAIRKPHGIVIVTGPTGSGKSTTLVAALRAVMDPALNIITVEDPVEYFIDGARQVKLNPKLDFEGALRAILRHDPDIVMVGEIRDSITANIAVKLANTGHLTFTTLHTNDAPSAIARLYKMGVEPFLIAYSLNIILAQRLVRKLCEKCKSPIQNPDVDALVKLGFSQEEIPTMKLFRPIGCSNCIKGYKGRTAIYEALYVTKGIRKIILDSEKSIDEDLLRRTAEQQGMRTLRHAGLDLVRSGQTSPEEIASVTVDED